MKKKIVSVVVSFFSVVNLMSGTFAACAESPEEYQSEPYIVTVTAVKEEGLENGLINGEEYLLSDSCALSKIELEKYSDGITELEYGDVLRVCCEGINEIIPGQYVWGNDSNEPKIEYLGTAADYYGTKKLTVKSNEQNGQSVVFEDSEGNEYLWHNHYNTYYYNPVGMKALGYYVPEEFEPTRMKTGDRFVCAVSTEIYYSNSGKPLERDCVVAPVSAVERSSYSPGDVNSDGNIDLYDAIEIAESLLGIRKFTETVIADYNSDGKVDIYDIIGIAAYILKNN